MATETLFHHYPMLDGEEVVFGVDVQLMVGDDETIPSRLVLTNLRLGLWNDSSPFLVPITDVHGWQAFDDGIVILYPEDVRHAYGHDNAFGIAVQLAAVRKGRMSAEHAERCRNGFHQVANGDLTSALREFTTVLSEEFFHPGPALAAALIRRRLAESDAVDTLFSRLITAVDVMPQWVELLTLFRLDAFALRKLERGFTPAEGESPSPMSRLVQVFVHRRRGEMSAMKAEFEAALRDAAGDAGASIFLVFQGFGILPPESWPSLASEFSRLAPELREALPDLPVVSEEGVRLFGELANFYEDPCQSARADTELEELYGEPTENGAPWRVLEDWSGVLAEREQRTEYPAAVLRALATDLDAWHAGLEWLKIAVDPASEVEHYWGLLRAGKPLGKKQLGVNAYQWWREMADILPQTDHRRWLAGLIVTECLLRAGLADKAERMLGRAYSESALVVGEARDTYTRWASSIYGLYLALCRKDVRAARMYQDVLVHHPGFEWTADLCARQLGEHWQAGTGAAPSLDEFTAWQESAARQLNLARNPEYQSATEEFQRANQAKELRVVVGGETSSGKSSFINALIGDALLFVTAEEATAVPTSVSKGRTWSATAYGVDGVALDAINVGASPSEVDRRRLGEFVTRYSALSSDRSAGVGELRISAPTAQLPEGVTLVDSPGLNAHAVRTHIAQKVIDEAHACIFLLDAGAALKGGEMRSIRWASEAVGKTLFVINKMDRAIGDDDLDVDEDAAEDLLTRVRTDLSGALGTTQLNLFAVSSLPVARLRMVAPEAVRYGEAIQQVRESLFAILADSREQLIFYSAGKLARTVAEIALRESHQFVAEQDRKIAQLEYRRPPSSEAFRKQVFDDLLATWSEVQSPYIEIMSDAVRVAFENADRRILSGIQGCSEPERLKVWIRRHASVIYSDFIAEVESARANEWRKIGDVTTSSVKVLLSDLYGGEELDVRIDLRTLERSATAMPLASKVRIPPIDSIISDQAFATGAGAAAGAFFGTLLFPGVGTVVGGVLGSMAGGAASQDPFQASYDALFQQLVTLHDQVIEALDADMTWGEGNDGRPVILRGLSSALDEERERFMERLEREITAARREVDALSKTAGAVRRTAAEASDWAYRLTVAVT